MPVVRTNHGDIILWSLEVDGRIPNNYVILSAFNDIDNFRPRPPAPAPAAVPPPVAVQGNIADNAIQQLRPEGVAVFRDIAAEGGNDERGAVQGVQGEPIQWANVPPAPARRGLRRVVIDPFEVAAVAEQPIRGARMIFGGRARIPNEYVPNASPIIEGTREKYKPAIEIKNPSHFAGWAASLEAFGYSNYGARYNNVLDDYKFLYELNPHRYLVLSDINTYCIAGLNISHKQSKFGYGNLFVYNSFTHFSQYAAKVVNNPVDLSFKRLTGNLD